jgi:hypothetical protein
MNTSRVLVVLITIACDAGDVHNCDIAEINEIGLKRRLQSQHLHQRGFIKTKKRGSSVTMAITGVINLSKQPMMVRRRIALVWIYVKV